MFETCNTMQLRLVIEPVHGWMNVFKQTFTQNPPNYMYLKTDNQLLLKAEIGYLVWTLRAICKHIQCKLWHFK